MYLYTYVYTYIRRPLQSVERVRLHLLAYNIQSLSNYHPSKQGPEEDISPASQGSQAAGIQESYPPGTQAAGIQDLGARMLRSYHLIILSSSIGDLLGRHRPPQAATGCPRPPRFWSRIQQISINRCSRLNRQAKREASKHPSIQASGPRGRRQRR